jgi:tetratricopeptide (TPR) repeat protein
VYYYNLANNPKTSSDLPRAYKFYIKLKEQNLIKRDTFQAIQNLRQIAIIQYKWGDYYASEASVVNALKLLDKINTNDSTVIEAKIGLYNQVGRIYRALLKYESAIEYYNKALLIADSQDKVNTIRNNLALIYRDQQKYNLAEKELREVYESSVDVGNIIKTARALDNLGFVRSKLNDPQSLQNLLKALDIRLSNNDTSGLYSSYKHLSIYHKDRNEKDKALHFATKALEVAKKINTSSFTEDALSHMLEFSNDANVIAYKQLLDSLKTARQIQDNKNALLKFNVTEEKRKTHESELNQVKTNKEKLKAQGITVIIVLLSGFLFYMFRIRHKKEKILQVYNTETRISKKVHDEVANDVYQVMTKLQADHNSNNEALLDDLENVYIKTRDISKENSAIDFKEEFKNLLNDLLLGYNGDNVSVVTRGLKTIHWKAVPNLTKTAIYRVLQELMTNMRKHSKATIAVLTFKKQASKIVIAYKDNGVGCNLKKQSGLQNAENRIISIKGTINFESEISKGFKAKIVV